MPISERTPLSRAQSTHRYYYPTPTFPSYYTSRRKPRRWPLVLRFIKGSIHADIFVPVLLHIAFTALIVYLSSLLPPPPSPNPFHLPTSTISSLSIVVGLMLVFRNSTSYDRFWQGSRHLTAMCSHIRNLTRSFLVCSYTSLSPHPPTSSELSDTEHTVRLLLALLYTTKTHLRAEYGDASAPLPTSFFSLVFPQTKAPDSPSLSASYSSLGTDGNNGEDLQRGGLPRLDGSIPSLLPPGILANEEAGLGVLQQLALHVEGYIKRGHDRGWFHAPQASQMTAQLNALVEVYGQMEMIHLTPLPVAILIHMRQVLALYCGALPFAVVGEQGWWSLLVVGFVAFTLYGIEAIGAQLEDPFGYDRNDIKVDNIVEDMRVEMTVLVEEWRRGSAVFPERFVAEGGKGLATGGGGGQRKMQGE